MEKGPSLISVEFLVLTLHEGPKITSISEDNYPRAIDSCFKCRKRPDPVKTQSAKMLGFGRTILNSGGVLRKGLHFMGREVAGR